MSRTTLGRRGQSWASVLIWPLCFLGLLLMILPGPLFQVSSWHLLAQRFQQNFLEQGRYWLLIKGLGNTLLITLGATLMGIVLGLMMSLFRVLHQANGRFAFLDALAQAYVTVIRGTPIMVQLLIWYFTIFSSLRHVNGVALAILAFGVNSGAYVAEIFRAGIQSIDGGQMEAGRSLGLSYARSMRRIILPQVLRQSLPVLINEFIALLKETSIAGYVAVDELTRAAQNIQNLTLESSQPLLMAALIYLLIVVSLTALVKRIERGFQRSDRQAA